MRVHVGVCACVECVHACAGGCVYICVCTRVCASACVYMGVSVCACVWVAAPTSRTSAALLSLRLALWGAAARPAVTARPLSRPPRLVTPWECAPPRVRPWSSRPPGKRRSFSKAPVTASFPGSREFCGRLPVCPDWCHCLRPS